nr:hypothetical protein [Pseudonocardiales bacterium]
VQDQATAEHTAAVHAAEQRDRLRDGIPLGPGVERGARFVAELGAELMGREDLREPVPLADQHRIDAQARTALQHRDRDLQEAHARDRGDVAHLDARVQQLDQTVAAAERTVNELLAEQQLRDTMDPYHRIIESQLRITTNHAQAAAAPEQAIEPHLYQPVHQPPEIGQDGPSLGR